MTLIPNDGSDETQKFQPAEPMLFNIGDIAVSQNYVTVPQGQFPIRGTSWTIQDNTQVTEGISTVGMVLAIVGFFLVCVLSLLFLLMKEKKVSGSVTVTVTGHGLFHTVQLPPQSGGWANQMVAQARSLAAA
ncbi:hypothetical protein [Nocardioides speluncae]|uniref:hypothetical protein n=1 Tax=Nocardioides speluncae TaxID=2670337 RepID=UPI000D69E82F|nr:hypothetical protein [Nocardioides speluncae]